VFIQIVSEQGSTEGTHHRGRVGELVFVLFYYWANRGDSFVFLLYLQFDFVMWLLSHGKSRCVPEV
jgi:hypothetical protein